MCSLNILCILNERGIPEGVTYFSHFWFQKKVKRLRVIVLTLINMINLVDFHESRWEGIPYNVIPAPRFWKQTTHATTECNIGFFKIVLLSCGTSEQDKSSVDEGN